MQNGNPQFAPAQSWPPAAERRPRVWPGVLIVLLYWAALKLPGWLALGAMMQFYIAGFGSMILVALFLVWWVFFSRIAWADRFLGLLAGAAIGFGAWSLLDPSWLGKPGETPDQRTMRVMFTLTFHMLSVVLTGCVVWMLIARSMSRPARLAGLVVVLAATWGLFDMLRLDGVTGEFSPEYSLRWNATSEQRLIAERNSEKVKAESVADGAGGQPVEQTPGDWTGFRGPARDGVLTGARIATDWKQHPPKELWRHAVGPGWSSFAVVGSRLYTQEQLGDDERIVCYDAGTGKEIWSHADKTRHQDAQSGAGPRATPTFNAGRIYALGGTGKLNCLDAATGKSIWSHDIVADSGAKVPEWGFSASPLVAQGIVTVFAGGPEGKSVLGYRADSGDLAWSAGNGTGSYCSLHPAQLGGVEQILVATAEGLTAFDPTNGKVLWDHEWKISDQFNRVTQPTIISDTDVLVGSGFDQGTRRLHVTRDGAGWKVEQVWESRAISPYFNDLVVYKGHIYGFHNSFLTCVNLETGKPTWKERGYANGQAVLLADQGLLVVLTEKGDVALVEAKPDARKELGRFHAIDGKTWNHPVIARGKLYVRNGEYAACYDVGSEGAAVASR
jgi:outer membrane protein assembly factor BamB